MPASAGSYTVYVKVADAARTQVTSNTATAEVVDWWPMFHYDPSHTGTSTSTGPITNNLLWTYTTSSLVWWSSPAVVGGLVYVGSNDDNVYCLNATTGTLVWSYTTGNLVYSSPAVVGGFVYVGSGDDNVYCLNAATGTLVWSYQTGSYVYSSPAVVNGVVYVGSGDGKVYALGAPAIARIVTSVKGKSAIIESNVTITNALVTKNTLHFYASGPTPLAHTGWITVTFPMVNTTQIKVFIDGNQLTPPPFPIITTNGTDYFIYFVFGLSTHDIAIQFGPVDDVAVTNVASSKTMVVEGDSISVNVTVKNEGTYTETFNVTLYGKMLYGNAWPTYTFTGVTLAPGSTTTLTVELGFSRGFYTLSAYAWPVLGEIHTSDNTYVDSHTILVAPRVLTRTLYARPIPL